MKKVVYVFSVILALGLAACSGGGKTSSDSIKPDSGNVEEPQVEEEIIETGLGYKITNKGIVPTSGRPMVVDFSADWCTPCKELKPIIAQLKEHYFGKIDFVIIDTDVKKGLTADYGIKNIPTLLFFNKDGEIKMQTTGFIPVDSVVKIINTHLE